MTQEFHKKTKRSSVSAISLTFRHTNAIIKTIEIISSCQRKVCFPHLHVNSSSTMSPYDTIIDLARQCRSRSEKITDLQRRLKRMYDLAYELVPSDVTNEDVSRILGEMLVLLPHEMRGKKQIKNNHKSNKSIFFSFTGQAPIDRGPLSPTSPPPLSDQNGNEEDDRTEDTVTIS